MHYRSNSKENLKKICHSFRVADFFILFAFLTLGIYLSYISFTPKKESDYVRVLADGKELIYPLDKDAIYTIEGRDGPSVIEVKDKKVRFLSSTCPNQTCVALGWGTTLVCLPNDIIVQVDGDDSIDDVSY